MYNQHGYKQTQYEQKDIYLYMFEIKKNIRIRLSICILK